MDSASIFTALSSSVLALLISLYVVPLMMRAAVSLNILDRPDQNLKRHREPTPYLGGMGIFLALLFSLSLILKLDAFSSAFFLGAAMIVTIGFVDDMKALSPKLKFFLQFLTVFVVIRGGVHITIAILPLWANYLLTFLWLLTIINAFNFLDIMDGLAATIGLASLAPLLLFSALQGNDSLLCLSSSFFGALLGFLPYNFPRAKIFLGDSGSMLIGYTVGVLCFALDYTAKTDLGLLNPPDHPHGPPPGDHDHLPAENLPEDSPLAGFASPPLLLLPRSDGPLRHGHLPGDPHPPGRNRRPGR